MIKAQHITTKRFGHTHHMILVTDERGAESVIHKDVRRSGLILKTTVDEALEGQAFNVVDYGDDAFPAHVIIANAYEMIGHKGYDLFFNNCEHFARWCCTGEWKSKQVQFGAVMTTAAIAMTGSDNKMIKKLGVLALGAGGVAWLLTRPEVASNQLLKASVVTFAASFTAVTVFEDEVIHKLAGMAIILAAVLLLAGILIGPDTELDPTESLELPDYT